MATSTPSQPNTNNGDDRFIAAIGYIAILCFVPLLLKQDSEFAQFHAKQGLVLFILEVLAAVIGATILLGWLSFILMVVALLFSAYGFVTALAGKKAAIPGAQLIIDRLNI